MRQAFVVEQPRHAALRALNYEPAVERLRRARRGRTSTPLRELVADLGSGYATVFARIDCDKAHGVELLSQSDMFSAEPEGRVIRRDSMQRPERHLVRKWDVLIAGAGTLAPTELYGRALIADERLVGKYVGQDSLRIEFNEPDSDEALFAYAYLASPTGLRALRSTSYGTKILRIRRDVLAELPVPHVDEETRARVASLVRRSVEMREAYLRELHDARAFIETLPEMKEAHGMCAERKARVVSWSGPLRTIMGWTYASHGGALGYLQSRCSRRVGDALAEEHGAFYGLLRQRTPCDPGWGIPFISQRDAHAIRQVPSWIVRTGIPEHALFSPPDSIVMAGRGTLGEGELFARPIFVTRGLSKYALTQDLLRVVPRPGQAGRVYAFLSTSVGRRLLRSCAVGTKIMQLRIDLIRELPLPELDSNVGASLEAAHARSTASYDAAIEAETEAIRIIEEEVLPAWLD